MSKDLILEDLIQKIIRQVMANMKKDLAKQVELLKKQPHPQDELSIKQLYQMMFTPLGQAFNEYMDALNKMVDGISKDIDNL